MKIYIKIELYYLEGFQGKLVMKKVHLPILDINILEMNMF
jgi:hypothetical protein